MVTWYTYIELEKKKKTIKVFFRVSVVFFILSENCKSCSYASSSPTLGGVGFFSFNHCSECGYINISLQHGFSIAVIYLCFTNFIIITISTGLHYALIFSYITFSITCSFESSKDVLISYFSCLIKETKIHTSTYK